MSTFIIHPGSDKMPRANKKTQPKASEPMEEHAVTDERECKCPMCPLRKIIEARREAIHQKIADLLLLKQEIDKEVESIDDLQSLMDSMMAKFVD